MLSVHAKGLLVGAVAAMSLVGCGTNQPATSASQATETSQQGDLTFTVQQVATPAGTAQAYMQALRDRQGKTVVQKDIDIGTIINLGKEVWSVITANQPVVNLKYDYATALPQGVESAGALENFTNLHTISYRVTAKNWLGMTPVDVTYTLVHQYNGDLNGKGKYLSTVAIIPANVEVDWGYKVDVNVNHVATTNVGTKEAPIGSASMELALTVHTYIKHQTTTTVYQFRGDSANVLSTQL